MPPPPPPMNLDFAPQPTSNTEIAEPRNALLESIRKGATLKVTLQSNVVSIIQVMHKISRFEFRR